MHALRQARFLARLVLAWFALAVGVAMAAPLVQPQSLQLVCSGGGGMKLVAVGGSEEGPAAATFTLDCPLCASVAPPPPVVAMPVLQPLADALQPVPAARIAALMGAPLPARGPPAFS